MVMVTDKNRQRPVKAATYRRSCLVCAMVYNYVPAGKDKGHEHKRGLFCSWACKSKHIAESKPGPYTKISFAACGTCDKSFVRTGTAKYCSKRCSLDASKPPPSPAMDRVCRLCGTQYLAANTGGMHKQYCSDQCQKIVGRVTRAARKAKVRKATIEDVDPYVVFKRDGWRCQVCGVDTPEDKRGSHDHDAPELDHVHPIAKGGEHSYANTQCACRRCNGAKSSKIVPRKYFHGKSSQPEMFPK